MKKLIYLLTIGIALGMVSCGKDGDMGPQGEQGEQGLQGIQGEKGEDGTTIYSGTVAPPENLGNVGDFYFRTSNSDFYGPKTAEGWGTATNLRGATGAPGAPGSDGSDGAKILRGTVVPAGSLGAAGDFYFRTTTADFYGPKTAEGWGTPINLRGPAGPQGPPGSPGNANVQQYEITVRKADWSTDFYGVGYPDNSFRRYVINSEEQLGGNTMRSVFDTGGAVLVYFNLGYQTRPTSDWTPLPYSFYDYNADAGIRLMASPLSSLGGALYISKTTNGYNNLRIPIGEVRENLHFRIVLIPSVSGISSSNRQNRIQVGDKDYTQSTLQDMSYDEVSDVLGLDE